MPKKLRASSRLPGEAVFMLRPNPPSQVVSEPHVTAELARNVLARVTRTTGIEPDAVNVFKNLGSFVVVAQPQILNALIREPEIPPAVANRRPEAATIPPLNKRPASIAEIGNESGSLRSAGPSKRHPTSKRTLK